MSSRHRVVQYCFFAFCSLSLIVLIDVAVKLAQYWGLTIFKMHQYQGNTFTLFNLKWQTNFLEPIKILNIFWNIKRNLFELYLRIKANPKNPIPVYALSHIHIQRTRVINDNLSTIIISDQKKKTPKVIVEVHILQSPRYAHQYQAKFMAVYLATTCSKLLTPIKIKPIHSGQFKWTLYFYK